MFHCRLETKPESPSRYPKARRRQALYLADTTTPVRHRMLSLTVKRRMPGYQLAARLGGSEQGAGEGGYCDGED